MFDPWVVGQGSCNIKTQQKSPQWVSYQEQMFSSQAFPKAYSSGVLILAFLPGRGSELPSAWYRCSKTFCRLGKEEMSSGGPVLSTVQPWIALNLCSNITWTQGPRSFCIVCVGALKRCCGLLGCVLRWVRWRQNIWDLSVASSPVWDGWGLHCWHLCTSAPAGGPLSCTSRLSCLRSGF